MALTPSWLHLQSSGSGSLFVQSNILFPLSFIPVVSFMRSKQLPVLLNIQLKITGGALRVAAMLMALIVQPSLSTILT